MAQKIFNFVRLFLPKRLSSEIKELYLSTAILNLAVSMVNIFEPVFLFVNFSKYYDLTRTLEYILLFYLAVYIPYLFLIPLGAKFAKKFGYEHSIALSTIFTVLFYLCLMGMTKYFWLIFLAAPLYTLWKMFYWPAYHSDFARYAVDGDQGKEISNLAVIESLINVIAPLIGGLILEFFGFKVLFTVVAILIAASNIPILSTKEVFTPTPFPYFEAFKRLFKKENRRAFFAKLGFGEEFIVLIIWPVFIYVVVKDFLGLGLLTAVSVLLTTVAYLFLGRLADSRDSKMALRSGTIFYFLSWLMRIVVRGVIGVFLLDIFSRLSKQMISLPVMTKIYHQAQDGSVTSTVVFFEMSLVVGKIIAILGCLLILQFFVPGWNAMFILAGLMTLFYLLFK